MSEHPLEHVIRSQLPGYRRAMLNLRARKTADGKLTAAIIREHDRIVAEQHASLRNVVLEHDHLVAAQHASLRNVIDSLRDQLAEATTAKPERRPRKPRTSPALAPKDAPGGAK